MLYEVITVGWIPVFVMFASALLMLICGLVRKLFNAKWIEDYALPSYNFV